MIYADANNVSTLCYRCAKSTKTRWQFAVSMILRLPEPVIIGIRQAMVCKTQANHVSIAKRITLRSALMYVPVILSVQIKAISHLLT